MDVSLLFCQRRRLKCAFAPNYYYCTSLTRKTPFSELLLGSTHDDICPALRKYAISNLAQKKSPEKKYCISLSLSRERRVSLMSTADMDPSYQHVTLRFDLCTLLSLNDLLLDNFLFTLFLSNLFLVLWIISLDGSALLESLALFFITLTTLEKPRL